MSKKGTKTYYTYKASLGVSPSMLMGMNDAIKQQQLSEYTADPALANEQQPAAPPTGGGFNIGSLSALAGPVGLAASGLMAYFNSAQQQAADDTREAEQLKAYRKTAAVDPSYMALGGVPGPLPVQAEDGEMILLPDGSSMPVLAKKKHKNQKDNDVTDVLPPDGFILSNDKRMLISKKHADKMIIGHTPAIYNENDTGQSPKEIKMSDLFRKDQHKATPADLMRNLEKMYPRTDREKDVFAETSKQENTIGRAIYLQGIVALNMLKKDEVVSSSGSVPKAADGADYNDILKQYQEAQQKYGLAQVEGIEENTQLYKDYFRKADIGNAIGTGIGAAFTAAQNSYVAAPQLQAPSMDEFKGLSQSQIESQLNRLGRNTRNVANALKGSGATAGQIAGAAASTTANIAESQSNMMYQNNATNAALLRKYYETRRNTRNQQSSLDTGAENEQTANQNRQLGAIGNTLASGVNTYVQNQANKAKIIGDLQLAKRTAIARGDVQAATAAMQMAQLQQMQNPTPASNNAASPNTPFTPNIPPPPSSFNLGTLPPIDSKTLPKGVGPDGSFGAWYNIPPPPPPTRVKPIYRIGIE